MKSASDSAYISKRMMEAYVQKREQKAKKNAIPLLPVKENFAEDKVEEVKHEEKVEVMQAKTEVQ
jgi:hypothetical protein